MGERKGTNKYYPPDYDPKKGGLNKFMGTHALRERARKLHLGIMIIRFEMPYNIWCEGCNNHIGMGVRYNAEKSKIGMYYSTPIYQFRMKCHLCSNHFEIKTDPGNLDYVIINGARRQERRWDPTENGQVVPDDKQVIHKLADDAMFKLQHGVEDHKKLRDVTPTLGKLENLQERWKDDYMANRALRDIFRTRKRELQDQQSKDREFLKKRSLEIPLLQESDDDAKVASLIRLQPAKSVDERKQEKRSEIDKKSQFPFPLLSAPSTLAGKALVEDIPDSDKLRTSHQLQVEQRRLSFGIKLKREIPSTITSAKTAASLISENSSCHDLINPESICPKTEDSLSTNSNCNTKDDYAATIIPPDKEGSINKNAELNLSKPDLLNEVGSTATATVQISVAEKNKSPASEIQKVGFFSSLVSYSDDSDHSSTVSDSETEMAS